MFSSSCDTMDKVDTPVKSGFDGCVGRSGFLVLVMARGPLTRVLYVWQW